MLEEQIKRIAVFAAIDPGDIQVTQVKKHNDVYMIVCPLRKLFLKT
jgi:hypothetical protein